MDPFLEKVQAFTAPADSPPEKQDDGAFQDELYRFLMPTPEQRVMNPPVSQVDRELGRARGYSHSDEETPDQIFERVYGPEIGWMQDFARDNPDGDVKAAYKDSFAWGDNWTDRHQKRYDRAKSVWDAARKIVAASAGGDEDEEYQVAARASKGVSEEDYPELVNAVYRMAQEKSNARGDQSWFTSFGKSAYRGMASIIPNMEATILSMGEVEGGTASEGPLKGIELVGAKQAGDPAISADAPWYKRFPVQAAGMAPQMGAGIGTGLLTGGAGTIAATAFWATQIYPQEYRKLVGEGVDEGTAKKAAIASAVLQGAVENLEFNPFKGATKMNKLRKAVVDSAKRYGKEVSEEGLQSIISTATEAMTTDMDDAGKKAIDDAVDTMLESAGPIGVLMAPGAAMGARRAKRLGEHEKAVEETQAALNEKIAAFHAEMSKKQAEEAKKAPDEAPKMTTIGRDKVDVASWVANSPELRPVFEAVAAKKAPSRAEMKKLLGPDVWLTSNQRIELADDIRAALKGVGRFEKDIAFIESSIPDAKIETSEDGESIRVSLPSKNRGGQQASFTYNNVDGAPPNMERLSGLVKAALQAEDVSGPPADQPTTGEQATARMPGEVGERIGREPEVDSGDVFNPIESPSQPTDDAGTEAPSVGAKRPRSNFAVEPKQRTWLKGIHEDYDEKLKPRPRAVAEGEADAELAENYEAVKDRIDGLIYEGRPLTEKESVQARRIILKEHANAMGDVVEARKMVDRVMAYTATRTEGARELGLRDPTLEPIENDRLLSLAISIYTPPQRVVEQQAKAKAKIKRGKVSRAKVARKEFNASLDEFAKYVSSKTFSVPMADPKIIAMTADLAAKAIKAGALSFGEFSASVAAKIGDEIAQKLTIQLEEAWMDAVDAKEKSPPTEQDAEDAQKQKEMRDEWAKSVVLMQDKLAGLGVDISRIHEYAQDDIEYQRVQGIIETIKASLGDKLFEYWSNAILSAPTTHITNIASNSYNAFAHMTSRRFADALISTIMSRDSGAQWGEFRYLMKGVLPGIVEGLSNSVKSWQRERPYLESTLGRTVLGTKLDAPRVAIAGKKGKAIRSIGYRPLLFADEFGKTIIFNMEVGARAYRRGKAAGKTGDELSQYVERAVADRSSAAARTAMDVAIDLTFQNKENEIAKLGLSIRKFGPQLGSPIKYITPFITTPSNILTAGARRSVFGSLAFFYRLRKGYYDGDNSAKMTEHLAEQLLAWGTFAALWMFMDDEDGVPRITGSEESYFYSARTQARQVAPPFSIRIGGMNEDGSYTWVSYARLEPFATSTALTIDLLRAVKSGSTKKMLELPTKSLLSQITAKSYLEGLGDVLKIMDVKSGDTTARVADWASGFASSIIPNAIRSTLRATDRTYRERGVWGDTADYYGRLGHRTYQRLEAPGYRGEQKIDRWGEVVKKSEALGPTTGFLYELMSPLRLANTTISKGDETIWRWNKNNPDDEKFIVDTSKTYRRDGKTLYMNDEQLKQYRILAGRTAKKLVDMEAVRTDNPTEADMKLLRDNIADSRRLARKLLAEEWHGGDKVTATPDELAQQLHNAQIVKRASILAKELPERRSDIIELRAKQKEAAQWFKDRDIKRTDIVGAWNAKRLARRRSGVKFDPTGDGRGRLLTGMRRTKVGK